MITASDRSRIVEMAWEDRTPFDAIYQQYGLREAEVKRLMRTHMKKSSWLMWRERVNGRATKHAAKRPEGTWRFRCATQKGSA